MSTTSKFAIALIVAALVAGVWLAVSPFLTGYAEHGADWDTATTTLVVTGASVAAIAASTLVGYTVAARHDALRPATAPLDSVGVR